MQLPGPLVSTQWLEDHLHEPRLRVFDTTIELKPNPDGYGYRPHSGVAAWQQAHIPGAGFLDVAQGLSDGNSKIPFTMPAADVFAATMARHGVADDSVVVLYNNGMPMWSTRVWWMLRSIGFERAAVLDGGWQKWQREQRPVNDGEPSYPPGQLSAIAKPSMWASKDDMLTNQVDDGVVTLNALSPEVYSGEKNQYGRAGHLPGTHNVFYGDLIDPKTGEFLPPDELRQHFQQSGALDARRVVTYCGGGISATMDSLALTLCGQDNIGVYDGSMSEWVRDESLPLKVGHEP